MGDPLELLGAIEDYVARAVAPMQKRLAQLEAERAHVPERGEKGEPGAEGQVDYVVIENAIAVLVDKELAKRPLPKDGRDAPPIDYGHINELIKAAAITVVADLPKPKDGERGLPGEPGVAGERGSDGVPGAAGKDADIAPAIHNLELRFVALKGDLERIVKELPIPAGEPGPMGPPGKDVDEDAMLARVTARALAAIPVPKDGAAGKDGADADEAAIVARVLAALPVPKDGVNGKDGAPGTDGRDGQRGPEGPEGPRGEPGRDALDGLSSIEAALRGERTLALDFLMVGGARKSFEFRLPIPIYRGLHKDGTAHERGDAVTRDGSTWIATKDTATAPPSADWTLAVKKGRDR